MDGESAAPSAAASRKAPDPACQGVRIFIGAVSALRTVDQSVLRNVETGSPPENAQKYSSETKKRALSATRRRGHAAVAAEAVAGACPYFGFCCCFCLSCSLKAESHGAKRPPPSS